MRNYDCKIKKKVIFMDSIKYNMDYMEKIQLGFNIVKGILN